MDSAIRKEELDVSKIFLSYLAAAGDHIRCARIANCSIGDVLFLERVEGWVTKLADANIVPGASKEESEDASREINRAACYVQARRLKDLVDKTLQWIYDEPGNLSKFAQEFDKKGNAAFSTKPVLDLVKAAEVAQAMLYRALGDKPAGAQPLAGAGGKLGDIHLAVVKIMQETPGMLQSNPELSVHTIDPAPKKPLKTYIDVESAMADGDETRNS